MTNVLIISWSRAAVRSCLAVYGPFVIMAIYTLLFVSCSHCKKVVWAILPIGPSLLPFELARHWLKLRLPGDVVGYILAFIASAALVLALAWLLRRGIWVRRAAIALALAVFSILAICTLAAIQA